MPIRSLNIKGCSRCLTFTFSFRSEQTPRRETQGGISSGRRGQRRAGRRRRQIRSVTWPELGRPTCPPRQHATLPTRFRGPTSYDETHVVVYPQLLDASADGASDGEMSEIVLGNRPLRGARTCPMGSRLLSSSCPVNDRGRPPSTVTGLNAGEQSSVVAACADLEQQTTSWCSTLPHVRVS